MVALKAGWLVDERAAHSVASLEPLMDDNLADGTAATRAVLWVGD